jgi:hypothetical protein
VRLELLEEFCVDFAIGFYFKNCGSWARGKKVGQRLLQAG